MKDGGRKTEYELTQPPSEGPLPVFWAVSVALLLGAAAYGVELLFDNYFRGSSSTDGPSVRVILVHSALYITVLFVTVNSLANSRGYSVAGYLNLQPLKPEALMLWLLAFCAAGTVAILTSVFTLDAELNWFISESSIFEEPAATFAAKPMLLPSLLLHNVIVLPIVQEVLLRGFLYKSFEVRCKNNWLAVLATGPATALFCQGTFSAGPTRTLFCLDIFSAGPTRPLFCLEIFSADLSLIIFWTLGGTILSLSRHYTSSLWPGLIAHVFAMLVFWGLGCVQLLF